MSNWWDRVGQLAKTVGDGGFLGDVVTEFADATATVAGAYGNMFDPKGKGGVLPTLSEQWAAFGTLGDTWNRKVYQPVIDDTLVGASLILGAPAWKTDNESYADYARTAWGVRSQTSLASANVTPGFGAPEGYDPVHDPAGAKDLLSPVVEDPSMTEKYLGGGRRINWQTGLADAAAVMVLDPTTYLGAPTKAATAGIRGARLVDDAAAAQTAWWARRGVISHSKANEALSAGKWDEHLRYLTENADPMVAEEYLRRADLGVIDPPTAAMLSSRVDDVERQRDLFDVMLNPRTPGGTAAAQRLKAAYGADFDYYLSRHASGGDDPAMLADMLNSADDILIGPRADEVMAAVIAAADEANPEALKRAEEFARGIDKLTDSPTPYLRNVPSEGVVTQYRTAQATARAMRGLSDSPVVTQYKPHRWHPTVWYVEKPAGMVEPQSAEASAEILATVRQLTALGGDRATLATFTDRWYAASTLDDAASARGAIAQGLNDYAVNMLARKYHDTLGDADIDALVQTIGAKANHAKAEIQRKGFLSTITDNGNIGVIRSPVLQRATPNAINMYDYAALDRLFSRQNTKSLQTIATGVHDGVAPAIDAAMGMWKVSVLMRLGYTIRNLTEASLSMAAVGQMGNIIGEVGPERMATWLGSVKQAGARTVDRIGVAGGHLDNPNALRDQITSWDAALRATEAQARLAITRLDSAQIRKMAKSKDPAKKAMAARLEAIKADLAEHQVTYYGMADQGAGKKWIPDEGRYLPTTPSPTVANAGAAMVNPDGTTARVIESYGATLDLTGRAIPAGLDPAVVKAARGGDRAAIQTLSDQALTQGYGRLVLPDAAEWGGVQVVVNPGAIGKKGRDRMVGARIQKMIDEVDVADVAPVKLTAKQARAASRQAKRYRESGNRIPAAINPEFEDDFAQAMIDGGAEVFAQKLATQRAGLQSQIDYLQHRLAQANKRVTKRSSLTAQGKAFGYGTVDVISPNGVKYDAMPDPFAGTGGGMWDRTTGAGNTYSILGNDSYHGMMAGGSMVSKELAPTHARYFEGWANILNLHFRDYQSMVNDPVVDRILAGQTYDDVVAWATNTREGYNWANAIGVTRSTGAGRPALTKASVEQVGDIETAVAGLFSSVDLYLPRGPLRDAFVNKAEITQDTIRTATQDMALYPLQARLVPTSAEANQGRNFVTRNVQKAMTVLGSIPETSWARHPLYVTAFRQERRTRIGLAEQMQGGQRLTFADLEKIDLAAKQAANRTLEQTLFTITRRSVMSGNAAVRTLFPFVAAYENVLQRWGKFIAKDPSIPVRASIALAKVNEAALIVDQDGNEIKDLAGWSGEGAAMVLPGFGGLPLPGRLGRAADQLSQNTLVPVKSLDVLTQGQPLNPGLGPFAVWPVVELLRRKPQFEDMFKWALPYGIPESNVDLFLPTAAKRVAAVWNSSSVYTNQISKAALLAQYRYEYEGGPEPEFEEIKKTADSMFYLRGLISLTSPVATSFTTDQDWYAQKLRSYHEMYDDTLGYEAAETQFFSDFPDAGLLVESLSKNPTGVRADRNAKTGDYTTIDNAKKYQGAVASAFAAGDEDVAGFVLNYGMPQERGEFSPATYRWQRSNSPVPGSSETYRQVGNPEEQIREAHVKEGWRFYFQVMDNLEAQLVLKGYAPEDKVWKDAMTEAKKQTKDYLEIQQGNKDWGYVYGNPDTTKYQRRTDEFEALLDNDTFMKDHGNDSLIQSMRSFLALRRVVEAELLRKKQAGQTYTLSAQENAYLAEAYAADVERLKMDSPEFAEWHNRFYPNDTAVIK